MMSRRMLALASVGSVTLARIGRPAAQQPAAEPPALRLRLAPGQSLGLALGLAQVANLRDLGRYRTRDGATVVHGLAYRSDSFSPFDAAQLAALAQLGLRNVYDLRTEAEVRADPDQLPPGVAWHLLNVLADARTAAPAEIDALLRDPPRANLVLGGGRIEQQFLEGYREFVTLPSAIASYRVLFMALADDATGPAAFHCTTGKDRTGWAAAALLSLLGVQREVVMADYMRSNDYTLPKFARAIDHFVAAGGERSIAVAILGVQASYLEASFAAMEERYRTIEGYFTTALGLNEEWQAGLRRRLLRG